MEQEIEIDICIDLINWIQNFKVTNQEIISHIRENNYLDKAKVLDKQRVEDERIENGSVEPSLTSIVAKVIAVLTNANPAYDLPNQRYSCDYLDIKQRIIQSCKNLNIPPEKLKNYISKCEYDVLQLHLSLYAIEKALLDHDVKQATELTLNISKEYQYEGWRLIADYYGEQGDKANFLRTIKKCDARKDKRDIVWIKHKFVKAYAAKNPLDECFKLVNQKEFGCEFLSSVMYPYTDIESFETLQEIMNSYALFDTPKLYLKEGVLTTSFQNNKQSRSKENFEILFDMIKAIPAKVRAEDFSLRDDLLSDIAECLMDDDKTLYKKEIDRLIKSTSSNIIKKSLKRRLD